MTSQTDGTVISLMLAVPDAPRAPRLLALRRGARITAAPA